MTATNNIINGAPTRGKRRSPDTIWYLLLTIMQKHEVKVTNSFKMPTPLL